MAAWLGAACIVHPAPAGVEEWSPYCAGHPGVPAPGGTRGCTAAPFQPLPARPPLPLPTPPRPRAEFEDNGLSGLVTVTQRDIEASGFPEELAGQADALFLDLPKPYKVGGGRGCGGKRGEEGFELCPAQLPLWQEHFPASPGRWSTACLTPGPLHPLPLPPARRWCPRRSAACAPTACFAPLAPAWSRCTAPARPSMRTASGTYAPWRCCCASTRSAGWH